MPTLYEYFGLFIHFYALEHLPIHVHCDYQDRASKAEIIFKDGNVESVRVINVRGKDPLQEPQLTDFRLVVEHNAQDIVRKWNDFFILNKRIKKVVIKRRYKRVS